MLRNWQFTTYTGCSETSCKFLRLVTQSFFGLFSVFWAFLYHKLWAIFHSSTSGTWNWKKGLKISSSKKFRIQGWLKLANFCWLKFGGCQLCIHLSQAFLHQFSKLKSEKCQFEPPLKFHLFWVWDLSTFFSISCPRSTRLKNRP